MITFLGTIADLLLLLPLVFAIYLCARTPWNTLNRVKCSRMATQFFHSTLNMFKYSLMKSIDSIRLYSCSTAGVSHKWICPHNSLPNLLIWIQLFIFYNITVMFSFYLKKINKDNVFFIIMVLYLPLVFCIALYIFIRVSWCDTVLGLFRLICTC